MSETLQEFGASFKFGTVSAVDAKTCRVRVRLPDYDNLRTAWLPVLQAKTLRDKHYHLPDLGEHVVVLLDGRGEDGVVLGAVYSSSDPAPVASGDKHHVRFDDGAEMEYDRASHQLTVKGGIQKVVVEVGADILLKAGAKVYWVKDGAKAGKTSFGPGSRVVPEYLKAAGLMDALDALGFNVAAFGCTTCIGNSGPLPDHIAQAVVDGGLAVAVAEMAMAGDIGVAFDALPAGIDACGENGEFHTLAFDGPMFLRPLAIRVGETVVRDGFVFTDLLPDETPEG